MKAQLNVSVATETIAALRARAAEVGLQIGDLADLYLRFGLDKIPVDRVREWALARAKETTGVKGRLRTNEAAVLSALERLRARGQGAWRFLLGEVANEAGLRLSQGYWALKSLQARGLVEGSELAEIDRWGRPIRSMWSISAGSNVIAG